MNPVFEECGASAYDQLILGETVDRGVTVRW